jgi:hypothetical protein
VVASETQNQDTVDNLDEDQTGIIYATAAAESLLRLGSSSPVRIHISKCFQECTRIDSWEQYEASATQSSENQHILDEIKRKVRNG